MVYGIVSQVDDATTRAYFKNKRVPDVNVVHITQIASLVQMLATKQGNRRLQATIYFLAIQMIQISSKGTPRHPAFRAYYEKRKAEGKTSQQALICISRRLISIIYGMLKSGTEYRMPVVESTGENI